MDCVVNVKYKQLHSVTSKIAFKKKELKKWFYSEIQEPSAPNRAKQQFGLARINKLF